MPRWAVRPPSTPNLLLLGIAGAFAVSSVLVLRKSPVAQFAARDRILNSLSAAINREYGYSEGVPAVNRGPCGRFARTFRECWITAFNNDDVKISFVMSGDRARCYHIVIKLPDGRYFDGGNGVMTADRLRSIYDGARLVDMPAFDLAVLDKWSYGLDRRYRACPDYNDATVKAIVMRHIALLQAPRRQSPEPEPSTTN